LRRTRPWTVQGPRDRAPEIRTRASGAALLRGELGEVVYDFTWSRNRDGPLRCWPTTVVSARWTAGARLLMTCCDNIPGSSEVGCMAQDHGGTYQGGARPTAAVPCRPEALALITAAVRGSSGQTSEQACVSMRHRARNNAAGRKQARPRYIGRGLPCVILQDPSGRRR